MMSGSSAKGGELKNLCKYFYAGIVPTKFHVMAKILRAEGEVSNYYYDSSFMYFFQFMKIQFVY